MNYQAPISGVPNTCENIRGKKGVHAGEEEGEPGQQLRELPEEGDGTSLGSAGGLDLMTNTGNEWAGK